MSNGQLTFFAGLRNLAARFIGKNLPSSSKKTQVEDPTRILFGFCPVWQTACEQSARDAGYYAEMRPLSPSNLEEFDAFVPLTLKDQAFVESVNASGGDVRALIVPAEQREMCHDKLTFAQSMTAHGFGEYIPKTLRVEDLTPNDFPLVVKHRWGHFGEGTAIVKDFAELEQHMPALLDGAAIVQECISGVEEYAVHLLLHDGKVAYSLAVKYQMAEPDVVRGRDNAPVRVYWPPVSTFDFLWKKILLGIGIRSGTVCINYRFRGDVPVIFEINPRVGGSLTGNMKDYLRVYMDLINRQWPRADRSRAG